MNILGLLTTHHKILIVLEVFYQGEEKSREMFFIRLVLVRQGRFLLIFSLEIGLDFPRSTGEEKTAQKHALLLATGAALRAAGGPRPLTPPPAAGPPPGPAPPGTAARPASPAERGPPGEPRSYLGGGSSGL